MMIIGHGRYDKYVGIVNDSTKNSVEPVIVEALCVYKNAWSLDGDTKRTFCDFVLKYA